MKPRLFVLLFIAVLLLVLGTIAAGCDGDDELTLEEYFAQVETLEFVGVDIGELGGLDINPAHPIATLFQTGDQIVADESPGAGYQHPFHDSSFQPL